MDKIVFYYGPKFDFLKLLPSDQHITTISELAIYSDKKMREHIFKIQSKRSEMPDKPEERLAIPCLVAFSEQYAAISDSAVQAFMSFIDQYDVETLYLQNPPEHIAAQFVNMHLPITTVKYEYRTISKDILRTVNRTYSDTIVGQSEVLHKLLLSLYPLSRPGRNKPVVLLFYGPTGVGKSETAQYLSSVVGQKLLRRQFSMFHSGEFASYLFGGRHTQSCLAKDLMERESSIILFDEFDKPNPVYHSAFYQLFDEGVYEDRNYRADVENAVIICTSNYSSAQEAKEKLGAPLFARFDAVIKFDKLSGESVSVILRKKCAEMIDALTEEERGLIDAEALYQELRPQMDVLENGRDINRFVRDAISERLLSAVLD